VHHAGFWLFSPLLFTCKGTSNPSLVIAFKPAAPHVGFFQVSSIPKSVFRTCRLQPTLQTQYSYQNTYTDGQQHYRFHFSAWIMIKNSSVMEIQSSNGSVTEIQSSNFRLGSKSFRCVVLDWNSPGTSRQFCSSSNKKNLRLVIINSWKSLFPYSTVRRIPASP